MSALGRITRALTGGRPASLTEDLAPLGRLRLAERFMGPPSLTALRVPATAESVSHLPEGLLLFLLSPSETGPWWRGIHLTAADFDGDGVTLELPALHTGAPGVALLALEARSGAAPALLSAEQAASVAASLRSGLLAKRKPIHVACNAAVPGAGAILQPGQAMRVLRAAPPAAPVQPPPPALPEPPHPPQAAWALERSWQEGGDTYVEGWIHAFAHPVQAIRFEQSPGQAILVANRSTRADLLPHYPMLPGGGAGTGFSALVPGFRGPLLRAVLDTDAGPVTVEIAIPPGTPSPGDEAERERARQAEWQFTREVNERGLDLLELGGRIVGPWSESRRPAFAGAARFIGFDIHPAEGVDVVGDAHRLSHLVGPASFDAVMSTAVLEHLAMPWIVAAEINRTLRPGGLSYHVTVQSWPVHEQPNDFWRFTDEALALLFGPLHGFEVLGAGMSQRIRMYPEDRTANDPRMGLHPGYGLSWVLSRKTADIPDTARPAAETLHLLSRRYPSHAPPTSSSPPSAA